MYQERLDRLDRLLEAHSLDAIALLPGANLQYLTGLSFHLMERPIMMLRAPGKKTILIAPELERAKVETSSLVADSFFYGESDSSRSKAFKQAVGATGKQVKLLGVEPFVMRFHELAILMDLASDWEIKPATATLRELRMIKNEGEVELMRQAVTIAENALRETLPLTRIGMSERELESELILQLLRGGSEPSLPFNPIVASGPNSALPHATPSTRKLEAGDLLILDWGARVGGYVSDLTRTFAVESLDPELETIHLIIQQANDAGRDVIKPGAQCGAVDLASRQVIDAAGYRDYFIHRTGHGIGLEAHEAPYIVGDNTMKLATGMTFTVEPGIYLPGRGGVRIEDNVVVTEMGGESMSHFDRALQIIGA